MGQLRKYRHLCPVTGSSHKSDLRLCNKTLNYLCLFQFMGPGEGFASCVVQNWVKNTPTGVAELRNINVISQGPWVDYKCYF